MSERELSFHIAEELGLEFVFSSGPAATLPLHTHVESFTLTLVRRGEVNLTRPDGCRTYSAGFVYLDAPHQPHSPSYSEGCDSVSLCLRKDRISLQNVAELAESVAAFGAGLVAEGLLSDEDLAAFLGGLKMIETGRAESDFNAGRKENLSNPAGASGSEPDEPDLLTGFQQIHFNRDYFSRRFKRAAGLSPHQYLLQSRIRKAKKLLAGGAPIAEVALSTGFYDQSHLCRHFKRSLGLSPRKYLKACFFFKPPDD